jgi:hypothetical protein
MTATITTRLGHQVSGQIRVWLGKRIVEIETEDGRRHVGRLHPDPQPAGVTTPDALAAAVGGAVR